MSLPIYFLCKIAVPTFTPTCQQFHPECTERGAEWPTPNHTALQCSSRWRHLCERTFPRREKQEGRGHSSRGLSCERRVAGAAPSAGSDWPSHLTGQSPEWLLWRLHRTVTIHTGYLNIKCMCVINCKNKWTDIGVLPSIAEGRKTTLLNDLISLRNHVSFLLV